MRHLGLLFLLMVCCTQCAPKNKAYIDSIQSHREKLKEEFLIDSRSPLNTEIQLGKLSFFKPDESYNCLCQFSIAETKKALEMPTYSGINKPFYIYGKATCKIKNKTIDLTLYKSIRVVPGHPDLLFLPFKDVTNGETTYEGGRYIDLELHDIHDGAVEIDFNKAYNPWCAYSDGFSCPIPPVANHLKIEIKAGEKSFKK